VTDQQIFLKVAWGFLGRPYIWGGDDPMRGFDCSGFVLECLKSIGLAGYNVDMTAEDIRQKFIARATKAALEGSLVFWLNDIGKATHIEIAVSPDFSIGASGGGSATKTVDDAIAQNAYIKVRPIQRGGHITFAYPHNS